VWKWGKDVKRGQMNGRKGGQKIGRHAKKWKNEGRYYFLSGKKPEKQKIIFFVGSKKKCGNGLATPREGE